ncbi:uncharacterized protein LOC128881832 isoform X1 [Hylaeus volcanicus]|uniref:uncharacterized protein LOC128881832 isoform X1 n=1 Tax=Hylaeus volcanicus TaxID=313075 RepID=UPI0023B86A61|nr:uncharacterized protein LOC128881832 isoform X1 [Hylaeus volcanicus]
MGKVTGGVRTSDSSDDDRRNFIEDERKARTKKKRRKRDLTDLHRKISKSRKTKETRVDRKQGKTRNSKRICNRILPKPLVGIYKNGAVGKSIRKSESNVTLGESGVARLQGNVLKLLHGYNSKSDYVMVERNPGKDARDPLFDPIVKNIPLRLTPLGDDCVSPVLGKVDGKKRRHKDAVTENAGPSKSPGFLQKPSEKKECINPDSQRCNALSCYTKLCNTISSDFEKQIFPNQSTEELLSAMKKKLRSKYAESFHNQLQGMMRRDMTLKGSENALSSLAEYNLPPKIHPPTKDSDFLPLNIGIPECQVRLARNDEKDSNQNTFLLPMTRNFNSDDKRNKPPTPNLLFGLPMLDTFAEPKRFQHQLASDSLKIRNKEFESDGEVSDRIHTSTEVNLSSKRATNVKYFENRVEKGKGKSVLFLPSETTEDLVNQSHLIKRKNQRTQTVDVETKGQSRKQNLKTLQQGKAKNLKHIPAILRRCKNGIANNNRVNIFEKPMCFNKQPRELSVIFTPQSLSATSSENSKVLDPPSIVSTLFNNPDKKSVYSEAFRTSCSLDTKQQSQDSTFLRKPKANTHPKTVMFTRKDSDNPDQYLRLENFIPDHSSKRTIHRQPEKSMRSTCAAHRNCQRIPTEHYQQLRCSQNYDESGYVDQKFKQMESPQMQTVQMQREPVVCEKLLLRRVQRCGNGQQCREKDQRVCYVVMDQPQAEKSRVLQNGHCCQEDMPDVGILRGVQNLQILPVAPADLAKKQCMGNTVLVEEQPVKYLAIDGDSKVQKMPIYRQASDQVASIDAVDVANPTVNYRVVSCPRDTSQKVILIPACEQDNLVYVKDQSQLNANYDLCSHPRQEILYQPGYRCVKDPMDTVDLQGIGRKLRRNIVRGEYLQCRPHEHAVRTRSKAVFYQE